MSTKLILADPEEEYSKDPNLKRQDIDAIFDWLKKQPHLPELTDLQAILFLHSCEYSVEAAKVAIDNYFTSRTHYPELFHGTNEKILRNTFAVQFQGILPKRTPEGYIVLLMKFFDYNPDKYVNLNHLNAMHLALVLYLHQNGPANGLIILCDSKGLAFGHLTRADMMAVKRLFDFAQNHCTLRRLAMVVRYRQEIFSKYDTDSAHVRKTDNILQSYGVRMSFLITLYAQNAAPVRLKSIHYINAVPVTEKLLQLMKPFVKSEIFQMINLHSGLETIYKYIPKECLPQDYNGELPSVLTLQEQHSRNFFDNLDFFKWHDNQKVDESKRQEKSKNEDLFGVDGTFKKLQID